MRIALEYSSQPSQYTPQLYNCTVELIDELADILEKIENKFANSENNLSDLRQKEEEEMADEDINGTI